MLDTSVAIAVRESHRPTLARIAELPAPLLISAVTRAELESGVERDPRLSPIRRLLLDALLDTIQVVPFGDDAAVAYGRIVAARGYSRAKVVDRLIAAAAMVQRATLITMNGSDVRGIEGLDIVEWPAP